MVAHPNVDWAIWVIVNEDLNFDSDENSNNCWA